MESDDTARMHVHGNSILFAWKTQSEGDRPDGSRVLP